MIIKSTIGRGLFAEIKNIVQWLYIQYFNNYNTNKILIDFSQDYFPYKDLENICQFNKILKIKKNIKIEKNLKIIDIEKNRPCCFFNFINYDQKLVKHVDNYKFNKINEFRYINNKIKQNYLIKLNKIFNCCIEFNENIINEANLYYKKNMNGYFIIGVHYRTNVASNCEKENTNHINYYKKINEVFLIIENIIQTKNLKKYKIYLATDCKSILEQFIEKYNTKILYNTDNIYMANTPNDIEAHFGFNLDYNKFIDKKDKNYIDFFHKKKPGLNGGIELIKDCLLLSKSNLFIPSLSNMSDIVLILNPTVEVKML